ncbi:MAG: ComF family protein [Sphingomonadales bacterium]|nr:ComF family protein [Sphingomonadales bacterium]
MQALTTLGVAIGQLFYPHVCAGCGSDKLELDSSICWYCLDELPATGFADQHDNPAEKILWGRVPFNAVQSGFYLNRDSLMEQLIYQLKYKNRQEIGIQLGRLLGAQLKKSGRFEAEALVPVPLHPKKLRQRGFNQAATIAEGMAQELNLPVTQHVLVRKNVSNSQTRLGRLARWENSYANFGIEQAHRLRNKRVLLVDDVLTTGATLESCGQLLAGISGVTVSMATVCISSV